MEMDEYLEHYGIKGMKWGVRRDVGPDGRVIKKKSRVRKEIESKGREVATAKSLRKLDKKTDDEIKKVTDRVRNENALKELTPKVGVTKKGRQKHNEYLDRKDLSDDEIRERVSRLRLEKNLKMEVRKANAKQIKQAGKIIGTASSVGLAAYTAHGVFSPTGNPIADDMIKRGLEAVKKKGGASPLGEALIKKAIKKGG